MQPPRNARRALVLAAAIMTAMCPAVSPGLDLTLIYDPLPSGTVPEDPDGTKLMSIMQHVASVYEDIFEDTHSVELTVQYSGNMHVLQGPAYVSNAWPYDERINWARIWIDTDAIGHGWFYDPTPADNSEFAVTQTLWRDLSSLGKSSYFNSGAGIPETFEVGYGGNGNGSDANTIGKLDLVTYAFRAVGEVLGTSGQWNSLIRAETEDGDYDLAAANIYGKTLAARASHVPGHAEYVELDDRFALETDRAFLETNTRVLPSHTDLLCMAAGNGYTQLDLPRREFYGGTDWNTPGNWSGNAIPGAGDAAFIRASGPAGEARTANLSADASVGTLTISEGGNFDTDGHQLSVTYDLFIDGLNTDFFLDSGGLLVVSGSTIHLTNDAELRLTGGRIAAVGTLNSSAAIIGHGTININTRLINGGSINVTGGTLVINAGSGSVNLDGSLSGLPGLEPGIVDVTAADSDLVINGSLTDDFNGILTIGPANTVSISEPWTLGGAGGGSVSSGRDGVVNLNGGSTSATAAVLAGGTITVEGDLNIPAGSYGRIPASVVFSGTPDGGATVVCDGVLQLSGPSTTFNGGSYTGAGTLVFEGVTQTFASSTTIDVARLDLDGGVSGNDVVVNSGVAVTINSAITDAFGSTLTINSGSFAVTGGPWNNAGTINLNKTTGVTPRISGSNLSLSGHLNVQGAAQITAALVNEGGTITTGTGASLSCSGGLNSVTSHTLTKAGAGTLSISGPQSHAVPATLRASGGTLILSTDAGAGGANLTIELSHSQGRFSCTQHLAGLNVGSGATATIGSGANKVLVSRVLSIDTAQDAAVDLTDNDAIIDYSGTSPILTIRSYIESGRNGGLWNGPGIRSSVAAATVGAGIGSAEASEVLSPSGGTFAGETVDGTAVLVRYTWLGDANLDGTVDITDLGKLATSWQAAGAWGSGDSNYDGFIDITDLGMLATNWQAGVSKSMGQSFSAALASIGLAGASVPEPSLSGLLAGCGLLLRRRRTAWC